MQCAGREGGAEVILTFKSMLLEQNVSGFRISCLVQVGQRFLCRQTRKEFLKVPACDGKKKIGTDELLDLSQGQRGE